MIAEFRQKSLKANLKDSQFLTWEILVIVTASSQTSADWEISCLPAKRPFYLKAYDTEFKVF